MPPNLTYELIASDYPDVQLVKNKLVLSRFSPRSEISIVILAEGALNAESFSPTLCSKTTKGKIVEKLEYVPSNVGNTVLIYGFWVVFLALLFILPPKWTAYQNEQREIENKKIVENYSFLKEAGWRDFDDFVLSEIHNNYSKYEFPIIFETAQRKGNIFELKFMVTNKTATTLKVRANYRVDEEGDAVYHTDYPNLISVNPMQSVPIVVGAQIPPKNNMRNLRVFVLLIFGKDKLFTLEFNPSLNKTANQVLKGKPASKGR
jgi:hypothetical protein